MADEGGPLPPRARTVFLQMLKEHVKPTMQRWGFRKKEMRFVRWTGSVAQVIEFEGPGRGVGKAWEPTDTYWFYVHGGVYSKTIGVVFPAYFDPPSLGDCHVRIHNMHLFDLELDRLWEILLPEEAPVLAAELLSALETHALPKLDRLTNDEALREFIASNPYEVQGVGVRRSIYLLALLQKTGPEAEFQRVLAEVKANLGSPPSSMAQAVERLGITPYECSVCGAPVAAMTRQCVCGTWFSG